MAKRERNWYEESFRKVHVIFESPEWTEGNGEKFNTSEFVELLKEAEITCIEFYTKLQLGQAIYKTDKRPTLVRDILAELLPEAHSQGIKVIAYHSFSLDDWMAKAYPDWRSVNLKGGQNKGWGWKRVCINSPAIDFIYKDLENIVSNYNVDGVWLDHLGTQSTYCPNFKVGEGCYCKYCRASFQKLYGRPIPERPGSIQDKIDLYTFRQNIRVNCIKKSVEIIKKYRPNALVSWNHAGDFWDWLGDHQDLKEYVDYYSNEAHYLQANTRHTQYYKQSFTAKHLQNHGKPFQGHTPGHSSWHTFIMKPVNWLRLESAVSLAHGGSATIGVNVLPDGKVEPEEIKRLKPLFAQIKEKEGYVRDAEPVKDVAVLYSMSSAFAEGVRKDSPGFAQSGPRGFHMALVDGHQQFIILNEMDITELQDYRLIIIPQQINLKESLISQLTAYIKGGGNLLLTYETSLFNRKGKIRKNFALSEVMGIDFINYSPYSANYAELNREMERGIVTYPLLFEKKAIQVNLKEAKPLGKIVYPEAERTEEKYYWPPYNYNPPYKKSDYPIITLNRYGKGKCIYIAVPIGEEVGETNNSWLKQLILNMVDNLLPEQLIETDAPAGVEIVLNRQKERKRYILHLINHYVVTGGKISLTDEKPILGPININLNLNRIGKINRVYSLEKNINWRIDKSWLRINISSMKTHSMVVIK